MGWRLTFRAALFAGENEGFEQAVYEFCVHALTTFFSETGIYSSTVLNL